jgi:hypothetical protein
MPAREVKTNVFLSPTIPGKLMQKMRSKGSYLNYNVGVIERR